MLRPTILAACTAIALPAAAQVTLDELDQAVREKDALMEEFRKRLNDPDPDRVLAALRLLLSKGDADQRRLAIRHGLLSTDRGIRATTLRGFFDSNPTFRAVFNPVSEELSQYYDDYVEDAGGVIDNEGTSFVTFKVTGYDTENACWTVADEDCLVRMRGDTVSLWFGGSWGHYQLNDSGKLEGEQRVAQNYTQASIDLSQ